MNLTLTRFQYHPKATLGYLYAGGTRFATLEEPWTPDPEGPGGQRREPGHYESCVPDGVYHLLPHSSEKFGQVWRLSAESLGVYDWPRNIPAGQRWGRATILIHAGNVLDHTLGCILLGGSHDGYDRITGGTSRAAIEKLRTILGTSEHWLEIRPTFGTREDL